MHSPDQREKVVAYGEIFLRLVFVFSACASLSSMAILFSREYEIWLTQVNLYHKSWLLRFLVEEMQRELASGGDIPIALSAAASAVVAYLTDGLLSERSNF